MCHILKPLPLGYPRTWTLMLPTARWPASCPSEEQFVFFLEKELWFPASLHVLQRLLPRCRTLSFSRTDKGKSTPRDPRAFRKPLETMSTQKGKLKDPVGSIWVWIISSLFWSSTWAHNHDGEKSNFHSLCITSDVVKTSFHLYAAKWDFALVCSALLKIDLQFPGKDFFFQGALFSWL